MSASGSMVSPPVSRALFMANSAFLACFWACLDIGMIEGGRRLVRRGWLIGWFGGAVRGGGGLVVGGRGG